VKRLVIVFLAVLFAGCNSDTSGPLCDEHQRFGKATSKQDRDQSWQTIERKLAGEIGLARMMATEAGGVIKPFIPHSDCPKCDDLIERYLFTQIWLNQH
jgi:hypothetical protein